MVYVCWIVPGTLVSNTTTRLSSVTAATVAEGITLSPPPPPPLFPYPPPHPTATNARDPNHQCFVMLKSGLRPTPTSMAIRVLSFQRPGITPVTASNPQDMGAGLSRRAGNGRTERHGRGFAIDSQAEASEAAQPRPAVGRRTTTDSAPTLPNASSANLRKTSAPRPQCPGWSTIPKSTSPSSG